MAQVITSPLAVVKAQGQTVGKLQNVRVDETYNRVLVNGIGDLAFDEAPVISFSGTVNFDLFLINFSESSIPFAIRRFANSIEDFVNSLILNEEGVQIEILKKVKDSVDPNTGNITPRFKTIAAIYDCFITGDGFNIVNQQVSGRNQSFIYTKPIVYFN